MGGFVGRIDVLADLARFVGEAAAGRGGLQLIAGEPGIGKTSLVTELVARRTDVHAVWGSCWEGEGAPALWPWIQILRAIARAQPDTPRDPILGRLLPELGAPIATQLDEATRFQLFDAVATFLATAARARPLLVVLDDLHWADTSSLLLLGFLISELRAARVAVIGTYRDSEAGPGLNRLLTSRVGVISLGGLDTTEVSELMRATTSREPSNAAAEALHRATAGNPFFVREMLRTPDAAVPDSVGEVIRRRAARLSPPARALADACSVVGHQCRLDVLARVVATEPVSELLAARLLEEDPASAGQFRFPHAVVREVLYRALAPEPRMNLHRRVGDALAALGAEPAELAHHFAQSAMVGTADRAIVYAEKAGQRALAMLAYEDAIAQLDRALALMPAADPRRAELLFSLGRAHHAAGHTAESHAAFEKVAQLSPSPELLAATALAFTVEFTAGIVDAVEVRLLEQALAVLPATDHPLRARVLARLGKALLFAPASERRAALTEEAAAMARRIGDHATLAAVLYDRHIAMWGGANVEERLAIANEVIALAERSGDAELAVQAHALRIGNLVELGDFAALQVELETYDTLTTQLRQPHYLWHVPMLRATLASLACQWDVAEQLGKQGHAIAIRAQHQGAMPFYAAVVSMVRLLQGRFAELEPTLANGLRQYPALATFHSGHAFALVEAGRRDEARDTLERLIANGLVAVPRDFTYASNLALLTLTTGALGHRDAAALLYDLLLPYERYCVRLSRMGIGCMGAVAHYLGLLAATLERWQIAADHFERAIEINLRIGAPAFVANSRYQFAKVVRQLGHTARAAEEQQRAEVAAATLGFRLMLTGGAASPTEAVLARDGDTWSVRFRGATHRLKDAIGIGYLARLLAEPHREIPAIELSGAFGASTGMPLLDARAKGELKQRLADLDAELREAEARGDTERAALAQEEIEALSEHVAQAVGLGGRDRRASSDVERARMRVTKALKAVIRRLAEHDRALAEHLDHAVKTGAYCCYAPDPTVALRWHVTT